MRGTQGIFVGYVENSTTIYEVWDLERRYFTTSDSLRFRDMEFPPASLMDDEPPISVTQAPYQHPVRATMAPAPRPTASSNSCLLLRNPNQSQQRTDVLPESPPTAGQR
jgi:hypothetical protein